MLRRTAKLRDRTPPPLFPHLHALDENPNPAPPLRPPPPSPLPTPQSPPSPPSRPVSSSPPMWKLVFLLSIAVGVQMGLVLQFILLVPFVERLYDTSKWTSIFLICVPLSNFATGVFSHGMSKPDKFGRSLSYVCGIFLMKTVFPPSMRIYFERSQSRWKGLIVFVQFSWFLDWGNSIVLICTRELFADLSSYDQQKLLRGSAMYSFFMFVGSAFAYVAGVSYVDLNTYYFLHILSLACFATITLSLLPQSQSQSQSQPKPKPQPELAPELQPMRILSFVTALNSVVWFAFILDEHLSLQSVSLAFMLIAGTSGIISLLADSLWRCLGCGRSALRDLMIVILLAELAVTLGVSTMGRSACRGIKPDGIKAATLSLFGFMVIPQVVTFIIPFAPSSLGVSTVMMVIAQMLVSLIGWSLDAFLGGGCSPAFVLGVGCAILTMVAVLRILMSA